MVYKQQGEGVLASDYQQTIEALRAENELLSDKLNQVLDWCNAYPEDVFIPPTSEEWANFHQVLKNNGLNGTAFSGDISRHIVNGIKAIIESGSKEQFALPDDITPGYVPSPGEVIRDELKARGCSQRDLANMMVRPIQVVNDIINAKTEITTETAIELGAAFGTSADFWLNLEKDYRLWLEGQESESE